MDSAVAAAVVGARIAAEQIDAIANDVANVNTPGYKGSLFSAYVHFPEEVPGGTDASILREHLVRSDAFLRGVSHIDLTPGALEPTGRALDVAIDGEGFFAVETPAGVRYTRNGEFAITRDGRLSTHDGYPVLGTVGPIELPEGPVEIASDGSVYVDGAAVDTLRIVAIENAGLLEKEGGGLFRYGGEEPPAVESPNVRSGSVEGSNVQTVAAMVEMIAAQRAHGAYMDIIRATDEMDQRSISSLGTLRA